MSEWVQYWTREEDEGSSAGEEVDDESPYAGKEEEEKSSAGEEEETSADKTPVNKNTSAGKTPKVKKTTADDLQRCPNLPSPRGKDLEVALKHLPRSGWLEQAPQGMVYVDLDDTWILAVRELLAEYGYVTSPLFFPIQRGDPAGAHIVLVSSQEAKQHGLLGGNVETGRKVQFSVRRCGLSKARRWNSVHDQGVGEGEGVGEDQEEAGGEEGQTSRVLHCGGGQEHQACQDDE